MTDYIEVPLPDGSKARLPKGMTRAQMAEALNKLTQPKADPDKSFWQKLNDFGPDIGTPIRAATAAVARGIADVPAIPVNLAQMAALGYEKATGMDEPSATSRFLNDLPDTRDMLASIPVIGPESQFRMEGTAGDYISTAGEFAGGAGALAGPSSVLRYGVVPGLASETAGQATEGTSYEPYARAGAALGASVIAAPKPGPFRGNSESARMANRLQSEGVRDITVGQATGSQPLMRLEGRLSPTINQIDDFTAATMRQLGSADDLATPTALARVQSEIVKQIDDAVAGVTIIPPPTIGSKVQDIAKSYVERVPRGSLTPRIRGIANEIDALAKAGRQVPLSRLSTWRSDIGKFSVSPDAATREAAHALRRVIDEMTDTALNAAGRSDDIQRLASARESYRNFIGVRDAASRAGAEGGTLSPTQLNQSMIRAQGRENYATGSTTPMVEFTRSGASTLRPAPTVNPGGERTISDALPTGMAAAGGALAYGSGLGPVGIGAMAAGGAMLPAVSQSIMRSNPVQSMMRNPLGTAAQSYPIAPGLLSQFGND